MDVSVFLARFWGWYLLIFFFVLTFNPQRIRQIFEDLKDQRFLILASSAAIVLGLLSILFHNIWEPNWKLLITGLGWLSLLSGLGLFIFPDRTTSRLAVLNLKLFQIIFVLLFLTGIFLLSMGYQLMII